MNALIRSESLDRGDEGGPLLVFLRNFHTAMDEDTLDVGLGILQTASCDKSPDNEALLLLEHSQRTSSLPTQFRKVNINSAAVVLCTSAEYFSCTKYFIYTQSQLSQESCS